MKNGLENKTDDWLSAKELASAGTLLKQLIKEVSSEEGDLSGGTRIMPGTEALKQLQETKVRFGNPMHSLTRLFPGKFKDSGVEISPLYVQQMEKQFDFYFLTLAVSMQPGRVVQFTRLECHLDFGPKGSGEPIIQSIFPRSEWREILKFGSKMDCGINANLEWGAAVGEVGNGLLENLPAGLEGKVKGENDAKLYVTVPGFTYGLGRTEIAAYGEGNSQCFWRIDKPDLKEKQSVQLGAVFKVPKGTTSVRLTGMVSVEPDFKWLTANLRDVFEFLGDSVKRLFTKKAGQRTQEERLPVGDHETWMLELPGE